MRCPACSANNPQSQRFCGSCGAVLLSSESETMASPAPVTPRAAVDRGQYVPGQILAGRYRMVGLLGRGGMGEVYRADDLKLGQPVALKFLPRDVENDPDRLQRFLDEVRLWLRVSSIAGFVMVAIYIVVIAGAANPSSWMFPGSVVTIATFMAIAVYGFWISLGEQKVFKDAI